MTRAFRNRMLRDAALFLGALAILLLVLVQLLPRTVFTPTAFALIIVTAIAFNLRQRRAIKAHRAITK